MGEAQTAANRRAWLPAACLAAGLIVRLPFVATDYRTTADVALLRGWARTLHERGLGAAYTGTQINYPPLSLFWLAGAGWLAARAGPHMAERALTALVKLPAVLADVLTAWLLMIAAGSESAPRRALVGGLYLFNPAIWYVSAHWGQIDSVYALGMAAAVLAALRGRLSWAWAACALALSTKLQSLSIIPLLALVTWRARGLPGLLRGGLGAAGAAVLLAAPWLLAGQGENLVRAVLPHAPPKVTVSAYNLWYLLLQGRVHEASSLLPIGGLLLTYRAAGIGLYAVFILGVLALVPRRPAAAALAAALLALGLFTLLTDVHERFLFPALALLLLAALGEAGERRAWLGGTYAFLSLTFAFNLVTIAPFHPALGTNLVAAQAGAPGMLPLTRLAVACAALNLLLLAGLAALLAARPRREARPDA